ncbi:MAG: replication/maintenance protein RepL [Oscillospiraceae bacterium]|nr:replication/maintenance protein RepL [Oscillospiraceae bacterium]
MAKQTTKKVKVVGTQQYINATDGTVEDFQVMRIEDRDFNFHKVWLDHIISSLDLIGNQKTRLAFWIVDHLDKENKLTMTYRQIAEKSGISLDTVRVTMKSLMESNFLERINQGAYRVNPDVIFKGGKTDRMNVLYQYHDVRKEQE